MNNLTWRPGEPTCEGWWWVRASIGDNKPMDVILYVGHNSRPRGMRVTHFAGPIPEPSDFPSAFAKEVETVHQQMCNQRNFGMLLGALEGVACQVSPELREKIETVLREVKE